MDDKNSQDTNSVPVDPMQPKPGDVIKPEVEKVEVGAPAPSPTPVPVQPEPLPASETVAEPIASVAPASAPEAVPAAATPTPTTGAPDVPETASVIPETPTAAPTPAKKHASPLILILLFVVLAIVGAGVYLMYFRNFSTSTPAPVEIRETSEATIPTRPEAQEDTTSLQYLDRQFKGLDSSVSELTNDTEIGTQLNTGSPGSNNSEL